MLWVKQRLPKLVTIMNYEIMIKKTVKPGFIQPWGETNLILFEILFEFLMTIFYLNSLKISVYFFIFEFLL